VHLGTAFEIDVSADEQDEPVAAPMPGGSGGVAVAPHAPPQPTLTLETVHLGQPLPALPIWLDVDLSITLDLESSYEETCRAQRIS
jgi:hypothetical protein